MHFKPAPFTAIGSHEVFFPASPKFLRKEDTGTAHSPVLQGFNRLLAYLKIPPVQDLKPVKVDKGQAMHA